MLPLSNVHTHTCWSDGTGTAEEVVRAALARGFVSLGFSDHGSAPYDTAGMRDEAGYRNEILRLKAAYAGQIEIALGYEHDFHAVGADLSPYEYIIESVHFLHKANCYVPIDLSPEVLSEGIDRLYGGDPYAMVKAYFSDVCTSIERGRADIVGHIGLITKFIEARPLFDVCDARYLACAREALALAAEKDLLVEINTGAMSRGYRSVPYPERAMLEHFHALKGRITVTSDCHRPQWLDYGFSKAIDIAGAVGFREAWIWKKGGFVPKPL